MGMAGCQKLPSTHWFYQSYHEFLCFAEDVFSIFIGHLGHPLLDEPTGNMCYFFCVSDHNQNIQVGYLQPSTSHLEGHVPYLKLQPAAWFYSLPPVMPKSWWPGNMRWISSTMLDFCGILLGISTRNVTELCDQCLSLAIFFSAKETQVNTRYHSR